MPVTAHAYHTLRSSPHQSLSQQEPLSRDKPTLGLSRADTSQKGGLERRMRDVPLMVTGTSSVRLVRVSVGQNGLFLWQNHPLPPTVVTPLSLMGLLHRSAPSDPATASPSQHVTYPQNINHEAKNCRLHQGIEDKCNDAYLCKIKTV